jgi:hypothetical protein
MFGLKHLPMNKLTTAFMAVSAAMVLFRLVLAPGDSATTTTQLTWIMGALVLIGLWIAVGFELARRFLGNPGGGERQRRTERRDT